MADIFLSYAREDRGKAERLAAALEALGWSAFWDLTVPPGETWDDFIGRRLKESRCVVVTWSTASVESRWVKEEAREGLRRNILVPVLFEDVEPPFGFGSIQAADLSSWDGKPESPAFQGLLAALEGILGPAGVATEDPTLRDLRRRLVALPGRIELETLRYEIEQFLADRPAHPEARRLLGQVSEAQKALARSEGLRGDFPLAKRASPPRGWFSSRRLAAAAVVGVAATAIAIGWPLWKGTIVDSGAGSAAPEPTSPPLPATLLIRSNVAGDEVFLDGAARGPTPRELELAPGRYLVEVRKEGCEDASQWLDLDAGDARTLSLELSCPPPDPRPEQRVQEELPAPVQSVSALEAAAIQWADARRSPGAPSWAEDEGINRRILIRGGRFQMGSPRGVGPDGEHPQHWVRVSPFFIQQHEVTNEEYWRMDPSHDRDAPPRHPVVNVTWAEASEYANWLGGSLPAEAQWEFAAGGAEGRTYPWGEQRPDCTLANFFDCGGTLKTVGSHRPGATPEGVEDLAGNVWEWCADWYAPYEQREQENPTGPLEGTTRVLRGAPAGFDPDSLRAAYRVGGAPAVRSGDVGFRVAFRASGEQG